MSIYMNFIVTTNQKPTIYTHTQKKKTELKHNTKENCQTAKEEAKRIIKEQRRLQKQTENNEQTGSKYILINNHFKCKWTKCSN